MKRLNLDQTWEQCLVMWKWISRRCKGKSWQWCKANIDRLKLEWLSSNGFKDEGLDHDCFFCEYDEAWCRDSVGNCNLCPARKIDVGFNCNERKHSYMKYPRLFYAELKRLNKIRLAKK